MDCLEGLKKVNKIIEIQEEQIQELEKKVETLQETTKSILDILSRTINYVKK